MNKSIQDKLNFIINGGSDEKSPNKSSTSPSKAKTQNSDLDFGTNGVYSSSGASDRLIKDEISSFFKGTSKPQEIAKNDVDEQMEMFKAKKVNQQKVKNDVDKFIESLPDKAPPPAPKVVPTKQPPKEEIKEEQKEEVKEREITKDFLIDICRTEEFNKVIELDLSYQKIHKMANLERFVNVKKLNLDSNKIK